MHVFLFFVLCLRSGLSEFMATCMVLICGVFQALYLSLVVVFNFSVAIFFLLLVDLVCSQAHILKS
jgi:hypothetical protein